MRNDRKINVSFSARAEDVIRRFTLSVKVPSVHQLMIGTKVAFGIVRSATFMKRRITSSARGEKDTSIFLSLRIREPRIRE
jgi:hypothetical protein